MDKWEDDIKRYLKGEMSPEEQHALEKRALQDPFLADALDGAGLITPEEFSNDLKRINAELTWKTKEQNADWQTAVSMARSVEEAVVETPQNNKTKTRWLWPLRIAASLVLLVIVYYTITPLLKIEDKKIVQSEPVKRDEPSDEQKNFSDSISENKNLALSETKKESKPLDESKSKKAFKPEPEETQSPTLGAAPPAIVETEEEIVESKVAELAEKQPPLSLEKQDVVKLESAQAARTEDARSKLLSIGQKKIHGKVLSAEDNMPLPGVNVTVKGTTTGTVTDIQGNYQLTSQSDTPTLVYTFIGLKTEEVKAGNQSELNVTLESDAAQLSEVVVTGYSASGTNSNQNPIIKLAEPIGGRKAYDQYLKNSLRYPQQALENKIKGKVTIQFTVKTDGTLSDFNVLKGLGYGCDEEVLRLVQEGPKWQPTTENNVAVASEVKVRVKFSLPQ